MLKTLLVDSRQVVIEMLADHAAQLEIELVTASSLTPAMEICAEMSVDILLLHDVIDGNATCYSIQDFQKLSEGCEILIYSEEGDMDHAEIALQSGAWDYVVSAFPEVKLPEMLKRIVRFCGIKKAAG